jgi:UDP-glucose 4-epimerase
VLVTGGTGFIGQHLVNKLALEGCAVTVLTRNPADYRSDERVAYIGGDFCTPQSLAPILAETTALYHLAATTVPGSANDEIHYDAETNLLGSLRLIELAAAAGVRRIVFASSGGSVYGVSGQTPRRETDPTEPISAHGVSKLTIEKYLAIYQRKYGISYRIARASNPYGEGQSPSRGQGLIAYLLGQLAQHKEIVIWGDGSVVRDYVYVKDVIDALWLMLDDGGAHTVYNVGSGVGYSVRQVIALLEDFVGQKSPISYQSSRGADVPYSCLDVSRIRSELGWEPRTPLEVGLRNTWSWIGQAAHQQRLSAMLPLDSNV